MKKNKKIRLKAKIVFEWEYEADPELYNPKGLSAEEITVDDMIRIDRNSFENDPFLFIDCCKNLPTLELVEVKSENA